MFFFNEAYSFTRLVSSNSSQNSGRLEVYYSSQWGTVCDDYFGQDEADVAFRSFGYKGASSYLGKAAFGQGSGTTWMDNVNCKGSERRIQDCPFAGWGKENCGHNEDVSVVCTTPNPGKR